jgi:hypothetical protein
VLTIETASIGDGYRRHYRFPQPEIYFPVTDMRLARKSRTQYLHFAADDAIPVLPVNAQRPP